MRWIAILTLSFALHAEDAPKPCLSGQGPLQDEQRYCGEIDFSITQGPLVGETVAEKDLVYDDSGPSPRWIRIEDGKVELSDGLTMEDALLLMNKVYKEEMGRMWDVSAKENLWVNRHLHDDADGLNRIKQALKGRPVPPEPWHKRARQRI